jgi:hypothetical protein
MTLTSAGELCVGRTSAYGAGFLVNVQGNIYASAAIVAGSSVTATSGVFAAQNGNSSDYNYLVFNNLESGYGDWNFYKTGSNDLGIGYGTTAGSSYSNAMIIKYGGNVGIGTTAPEALLHINKSTAGGEGGYIYIDNAANSTLNSSVGLRFGTSSGASFSGVYTGDISNIVTNASNGASDLTFGTFNGSSSGERMRISSSGNIGIGTSTLSTNSLIREVLVSHSVTNAVSRFKLITDYNSQEGEIAVSSYLDENLMVIGTNSNSPLLLKTNATERMRISSGGNLLVNNTSSVGSKLIVRSDGTTSSTFACIFWDSATSDLMYVRSDGYGYLKASAWVYGSDSRMKENVSNVENGLDMVLKMKPKHFDYINGQKNNLGFIAQDIQKIIPEAVSITNEKTGMLGLKTDFLIPYLVKAIQEQQVQIEQLKNK